MAGCLFRDPRTDAERRDACASGLRIARGQDYAEEKAG
jgi:hypothetical protein